MFEIISKQSLAQSITRMEVYAPHIARKCKPGQFIMLRVHEKGERIPLTICTKDRDAGTITLIIQEVGKTTHMLCALNEGDRILDLAGPFGRPTHIEKVGTVVAIGGGVGTAVLYHVLAGFREAGNYVISILGARSESLVILEDEIRSLSDEFILTTDDGTKGRKGFVSDALKDLIAQGRQIDQVVAIGPVPMMRVVSGITKEHNIPTIVSLNPIMVDGTGMCGGCRVEIGGETRFACVDGPEFDGHAVNWDLLTKRLATYREAEQLEMHTCRLTGVPQPVK
jgi:ferredoxin--NADP+ reductase